MASVASVVSAAPATRAVTTSRVDRNTGETTPVTARRVMLRGPGTEPPESVTRGSGYGLKEVSHRSAVAEKRVSPVMRPSERSWAISSAK